MVIPWFPQTTDVENRRRLKRGFLGIFGRFTSSWQLHKAGNRMLIFQFAKCLDKLTYNVVKTIINHPIFDGLYPPMSGDFCGWFISVLTTLNGYLQIFGF